MKIQGQLKDFTGIDTLQTKPKINSSTKSANTTKKKAGSSYFSNN